MISLAQDDIVFGKPEFKVCVGGDYGDTDLVLIYTSIVTIASIIVKLTPTIKDDDALKSVIKFIGKFIALNR
jgi:hypothetical protein